VGKVTTLVRDFITEKLKRTFKGRESLSRQELFDFFLQFDPDLKESTFRWRIYNLKDKNLISQISRHRFSLTHKPVFEPLIGEKERKIATLIRKQFKELKFAIWSTRIVNEFMLHQPSRCITIIEVERDAIEPVFYFLKDSNIKAVFLDPEEKEIDRYIYGLENAVVVLPLVSKSPIQGIKNAATITIEKLLVDLFSDRQLYNAYQGSELAYIFNNAYSRYAIDFTKLFSYATRRRNEEDLKNFLVQKTDIPQTIFNDAIANPIKN
jgi:hypothetical protein